MGWLMTGYQGLCAALSTERNSVAPCANAYYCAGFALVNSLAIPLIYSWYISPKHALSMNRHILVSHFGHLASLVWAKLILGRFRDAVLPDFSRFHGGSDDYLNAFFTDPRPGRYCGRYVPGA